MAETIEPKPIEQLTPEAAPAEQTPEIFDNQAENPPAAISTQTEAENVVTNPAEVRTITNEPSTQAVEAASPVPITEDHQAKVKEHLVEGVDRNNPGSAQRLVDMLNGEGEQFKTEAREVGS